MANPIPQREWLSTLRRGSVVTGMVVLVGLLVLLVVAVWPDAGRVNLDGTEARRLFSVFLFGMFAAVAVLAPATPATSLVRERQRNTLVLLLTSGMGGLSIWWGKTLGSVGLVIMLMVMSLPIAAGCYVMGGVGLNEIVMGYAVLMLAAIQFTLLGLCVSAIAKRPDSALRATYLWVLVLSVSTLGPALLLDGSPLQMLSHYTPWISAVSGVTAVNTVLNDPLQASWSGGPVYRYLIICVVSIVVMSFWLIGKIGPSMLDQSRDSGEMTDDQTKGKRFIRRLFYMWFFDPNRRSSLIGDWTNPVMVKEFRSSTFGRSHWMMRWLMVCLVGSVGLMIIAVTASNFVSLEFIGGVMVVFQMGLIGLITPAMASGMIASERESGGWRLLQMTPLTVGQILRGKLMSVGWTVVLLVAASAPGYAVLLLIDTGYSARVVSACITLALFATFGVMVAGACSALFSKTSTATMAAYSLLIVVCGATLLPWLGQGIVVGRDVASIFLTVNPVAAGLSIIGTPGFSEYDLTQSCWAFLGVGSVVGLVVMVVRTWQLTRPS